MASSLSAGFAEFRSNLEITDLQSSVVSTRQQRVREALDAKLDVRDSFLTGSYARSTMIAPLAQADIDVLVVLSTDYFKEHTPVSLLELVREELRGTYPKTPRISKNGQAVTIRFTDFLMDVVPAFFRKGGGYLIPNTETGRWIATNPKRHVELWSETNEFHQGDFIPLVKMLKAWNRAHSERFRSFHLESLARHVLTGVTISDFSSALRYFFEKAHDAVDYQLAEPAGIGGDIGAYMIGDLLKETKESLVRAEGWALKAEAAIADDRIDLAFDQYRLLFGDHFPAYG